MASTTRAARELKSVKRAGYLYVLASIILVRVVATGLTDWTAVLARKTYTATSRRDGVVTFIRRARVRRAVETSPYIYRLFVSTRR